jgi:hypothetical protein
MYIAALMLVVTGGQAPVPVGPPLWDGPGGGVQTVQPSDSRAHPLRGEAKQVRQTKKMINAAEKRGAISRSEARALRRQGNLILAATYRSTGNASRTIGWDAVNDAVAYHSYVIARI